MRGWMDVMEARSPPEENRSSLLVVSFYHIAAITDVQGEASFHRTECETLTLRGRLRVSPDGLNGTLTGRATDVRAYASRVERRHGCASIDWKLAVVAPHELFPALSVRTVAELVTLRPHAPVSPLASGADGRAAHLSPRAFHAMLEAGAEDDTRPLLLLDARNGYESAIGRFEAPAVRTLLPPTRQFSELPAWLHAHASELRCKRVLMYCTGGVRCEAASVLVRELQRDGDGDGEGGGGEVYQLRGGIVRYLEAHGGGSFFRGHNLLFDRRAAEGGEGSQPLGSCAVCTVSKVGYDADARCGRCRSRLLLCTPCAAASSSLLCARCTTT